MMVTNGFTHGEIVVIAECPLRHLVAGGDGPTLGQWTACSRLILAYGKRAEGPPTCLFCVASRCR